MPQVRVGDIELCYESMGRGEPLLLIMGLGAQLVLWPDDFCRALVDRGFRVIRFDNRDAGRSSRLDHLGTPRIRQQLLRWSLGRRLEPPYPLEAMADDAAGLLRALDISRAHVMGASMGGMIAQLLAVRYPARVTSLTSIMSHPGDRRSKIPRPRALQALLQPPPRTRAEAEESWVRFYRVMSGTGFPFEEDRIRQAGGLHFERGASPRGVVRQMTAVMAAPDRRPALRSLRLPSLVIHGSDDPLVRPSAGVRTAKALPGSTLMQIEGMGHHLPRGAWPRILDAVVTVSGVRRPSS